VSDIQYLPKDVRGHPEEAPTLTPVSDVKPSREEMLERDRDISDTNVIIPTSTAGDDNEEQGLIGDGDVEMMNGLDDSRSYEAKEGTEKQDQADHRRTDHDWHWSEPTARPDAVAAHLNGSMDSLYKLSSTRKEPCAPSYTFLSPFLYVLLSA
jgi:hypothetical protein